MYKLRDFVTKETVTSNNLVFTGKVNPWEVIMDMDKVKSKINLDYFRQTPPTLLKYLPLMPIYNTADFVTLREVATPLIKSRKLGKDKQLEIYFKQEGKNPTGSFKDRGSSVDISVAREKGAKAVILASTGNMAASCACYSAAAGLPCFILVPEGVPPGKLSQVLAFGGHIVQVKGTYNDAAVLAEKIADELDFYLAGDYAFRVEGQKTGAFEIIDQMYFQVPDYVIVAIGCGTNITAYYKGFCEYKELGLIDKIPTIIGVQATGACAVVNSFNKNSNSIEILPSINTLASAIAVANPIDGLKALDAIYTTNGYAIDVTDNEILEAQHILAKEEGVFAESSSAATYAGLLKLIEQNKITKNAKVVCVLGGDGLKDPQVVLRAAIKPPTIYPDTKEFFGLYENGFFASNSMIFKEKSEVLFTQEPSLGETKATLLRLFNANYSTEYLDKIQIMLNKILSKGKSITISDFQDAIQSVLESPMPKHKEIFSVLDFDVTTGKDREASANVKVKIENVEYQGNAKGVGPVDAIIKALANACQSKLSFKLTDYKVEIRSQGIDAMVYTELRLVQGSHSSLGAGTSSDIIQASIEAFAQAYNGF